MQLIIDALAPTNFALANPAVIKRHGHRRPVFGERARNFVHDVRTNRVVPTGRAGRAHGGRTCCHTRQGCLRNDLMELISTRRAPLGCTRFRCCSARPGSTSTTSWTSPGRSLVQWASIMDTRFCDQLPVPTNGCAMCRWMTTRSRPNCSPRCGPQHHRRREGQPSGAVSRRHADDGYAGIPRRRRAD